jgi:ribosomal protein L11 methyltransferase
VAIDNDPDALRNARENVRRNDVPVEVLAADLAELRLKPADIVLANLTGAVLQRSARRLRRFAAPGGVLIVSGFGAADLVDVRAALGGTIQSARSANDEWVAAVLTLGP